ncbi:MAG TPA: hypothetical protein VG248_03260 [Caulobacteraceae bacterium]|jgi:hypothetical protein|nr:hypothetical protein [Caulobacteraceae bacterium]
MRHAPALLALTLALAAGLTVSGCQKQIEAPMDRGVCWHLAAITKDQPKFNALAQNQPNLEHCAAQLDMMRIRFMSLGSSQQDIVGAYQGQFLFVGPQGVYTAPQLNGYRYLLMVHSGDGRLVAPAAMPTQ